MKNIQNQIRCVLNLKPHEATLTLKEHNGFHLQTVHHIGGQRFILEVEYDGFTELYDLNVLYNGLKNPIEKRGITEDTLILCCDKLKLYLESLNASTQNEGLFMELFRQFVALSVDSLKHQNKQYILRATALAQEFTVQDTENGDTTLFVVSQTDTLFPLGASLTNGKHCIVSTFTSFGKLLVR